MYYYLYYYVQGSSLLHALWIQIVFEYKSHIFLQIQIQILIFVKFQIQKVFEYLEYLTPGLIYILCYLCVQAKGLPASEARGVLDRVWVDGDHSETNTNLKPVDDPTALFKTLNNLGIKVRTSINDLIPSPC